MRGLRRIFVATAMAVVTGTTGLVVSSGPALAAPCWAALCAGHDPYKKGCKDSDHKTVTGKYGVITNYYSGGSSGCRANWARAHVTPAGLDYAAYAVVVITTTDSNGKQESMCYPGPSDTGKLNEYCYQNLYGLGWTDMVDGSKVTEAELYLYSGPGGHLVEHDTADF